MPGAVEAAEQAAERAGGAEQPAGLEEAALDVGLDGDLGAARLLALQRLAARQVERGERQQRDGVGRARARQPGEGEREEVVAGRARERLAVPRPDGRVAAPQRRRVEHVVVHERRHVHELGGAAAISSSGRSRASGGAEISTSSGRRRLPPAASVSREARPTESSASCAARRCSTPARKGSVRAPASVLTS